MILPRLAYLRAATLAAACALAPACGGGSDAPDAGSPDAWADAYIPPPIPDIPGDFLWGTAIAPYQVEGNLHETDWYQWETEYCGSGCSGDHADDGPGFWDRYDSDFATAEEMHTNAIRLGIEWARVFPTRESFDSDTPDAAAVARYHEILDAARAHGLVVMVTIHHFSTPVWLHDLSDRDARSGWEDAAIVDDFEKYARWLASEFGHQVDWWITVNEPFAYISGGWLAGIFPPGVSGDIEAGLAIAYNMIEGHARAYDAIHEADTVDADGGGVAARVSIASHNRVFLPEQPDDPSYVEAADMLRYLNNRLFLDAIIYGDEDRNFDGDTDDPGDRAGDPTLAGRADYIGLNYYGVSVVVPNGGLFPFIGIPLMNYLDNHGIDNAYTDFGWTIYPEGFREVLDEIAPYSLPIVITENGLADADDNQRPRFLMDHLYALGAAIGDGLPIRGYFHWSLLDNFEWASGYCPRFGLYHVDFEDPLRPRTPGEGAEVYRRIIDARNIPVELWNSYPDQAGANFFCPTIGL
jgi:beta-glucosidase